MRILIADDDIISRTMLKKQLESLGYETASASDGNEAWDLIRSSAFSMIISDWMMPGLSGIEFVKKLRRRKRQDYIYFILLTAKQTTEDLIEGLEAGADDFVRKPFHQEELRVRVMSGERIISLERSLKDQNKKLYALNQAIMKDLQSAARIQQSILPKSLPANLDFRFAYRYMPSEQLGGDTLNILELDDDHIAVYLLDVSGHGVSAALLAFSLSRMFSLDLHSSILFHPADNVKGKRRIKNPLSVIRTLNEIFSLEDLDSQYFTIVYGILNTKTSDFSYVSAGHPGVLHISGSGKAEIYHSDGLAIGFCPDCDYDVRNLKLDEGARIIFYSDGINEVVNESGVMFGHEKVKDSLLANRHDNIKFSLDELISNADSWQQNMKKFSDDISIVAMERARSTDFRVSYSGKNNVNIKFISDLEIVGFAVDEILRFKNEHDIPLSDFDLNLVCREALNNAVIHGNKRQRNKLVCVELSIEEMIFMMTFKDEGQGFDWRKALNKEFVGFQENGMGMKIICDKGFIPQFNEEGNILFLKYPLD